MGWDCANRVTKFLSESVLLHSRSFALPRPIPLSAIFSASSSPVALSPQVAKQPVSFSAGSRSELSTICPVNVTQILAVGMLRDSFQCVSAGTVPLGEPQCWSQTREWHSFILDYWQTTESQRKSLQNKYLKRFLTGLFSRGLEDKACFIGFFKAEVKRYTSWSRHTV